MYRGSGGTQALLVRLPNGLGTGVWCRCAVVREVWCVGVCGAVAWCGACAVLSVVRRGVLVLAVDGHEVWYGCVLGCAMR